jgi:hypothetical protein
MNFGALFFTLWGVGYLLTVYFNAVTFLIAQERDAYNGRVTGDDRAFAWFIAGFIGLWMWPFLFLGSVITRLKWRLDRSGRGPLLRTPNERAKAKAQAEAERQDKRDRELEQLQELAKANGLDWPSADVVEPYVKGVDAVDVSPGFADLVARYGGSAGFVEKLRKAEKAS